MASRPESLSLESAAYCLQILFPQHADKLNGSFNEHRVFLARCWGRPSLVGFEQIPDSSLRNSAPQGLLAIMACGS